MARRKKAIPQLKVFLDTNVIYAKVAYDFLRKEIKELIAENSNHIDVSIQWYLPEVVVGERRHQMEEAAIELLPALRKLETLLGHNLNITPEILKDRVAKAVKDQMDASNLQVAPVDTALVDWAKVIEDATYRNPPFSRGENEKGFRDAIIAETFHQLVKASPTSASACRLAFVSGDRLLTQHIRDTTKDRGNVRVLAGSDDLASLINTLVSTVPEEFVEELSAKASLYFYDREKRAGLFYKEGVIETIRRDFGAELGESPSGGVHMMRQGTWLISQPVFVRKHKQRVSWTSTVTAQMEAHRYAPSPGSNVARLGSPIIGLTQPPSPGVGPVGAYDFPKLSFDVNPVGVFNLPEPELQLIARTKVKFDVHWSVNITQTNRLTAPRVESIEFLGSAWEPVS